MTTKAKKKTQPKKSIQIEVPIRYGTRSFIIESDNICSRDELFNSLRGQLFQTKLQHKDINILLNDLEVTFKKCLATAVKKNADYAGIVQTDPYKNLRGSEFVGVDPARAILVRMMDKMSRISNLLNQEAQVKDEAIEDTLDDMINYAAILKSYIKNNKKKTV